ncbi:MAG: SprB repeat-containing protein, partial [Flavobacteriales bacterium]|nr:SprB repeat-containing protein [Flavobacteriales bacterium]
MKKLSVLFLALFLTQFSFSQCLSVSVTSVEPACGSSSGVLSVNLTGGVTPYSYLWGNGQTTSSISGLTAACYWVTLSDNAGCTKDSLLCVSNSSGPSITLLSQSNVSCYGSSDGTINTSISGGTTPYSSYYWYNKLGDIIGIDPNSVLFLIGDATYYEIVTDAVGCIGIESFYVGEPTPVVASIISSTSTSCFGGADGDATVQAGGGTTPYSYEWIPANQTTITATGMWAGPYVVVTEDVNGCSVNTFVTITEPPPLVYSSPVVDATCYGYSNGSLSITVAGGTTPYNYLWSFNAETTSSISGLIAGGYNCTVTDQNGCGLFLSAAVSEPSQLGGSIVSTDATCTFSNGQASILGQYGGTPSYSYSWSSGQTTATVTGLFPASYTVTMTDALNCTFPFAITVADQSGPTITSVSSINPLCYDDCNGTATVNITGGTSPLSYSWDDFAMQASQTAINLCAESYNVTVTDNNGCVDSASVTVVEPQQLTVTSIPSASQLCSGECETLFVSPSGGSGAYSITWGDNGSGFVGFGGHTVCPFPNTISLYSFTVTDANGCASTDTIILTVGNSLLLDAPDTVEYCPFDSVYISCTGFGGAGYINYQWTWSNGYVEDSVISSGINTLVFQMTS